MGQGTRRDVLAGIGAIGTVSLFSVRASLAQEQPAQKAPQFKAEDQRGEKVTRASMLDDLVTANHILAHEGVLDAFGHVSLRDPADPHRFIMARQLAPELIVLDDLITYDLDGNAVENQRGRPQYAERAIHGEIYKARPDVSGVVHSHTATVIPFADTGVQLKAMNHMTSFLYRGAPIFDIRAVAGDGSIMLVNNNKLGHALAQTLGHEPVVLMRGHGMTVVGGEIREAVYRAIYTNTDAQMETEAIEIAGSIKRIEFLSMKEGARLESHHSGEAYNRAWFMWKARVSAK